MEDNLLAEMSEGFLIIYTMYREQKIASFQKDKHRFQLLQITTEKLQIVDGIKLLGGITKWQIRKDRKYIFTTISRHEAEKYFATIVTNELLQQKFYF